jgi:hypothetical protein
MSTGEAWTVAIYIREALQDRGCGQPGTMRSTTLSLIATLLPNQKESVPESVQDVKGKHYRKTIIFSVSLYSPAVKRQR